MKIQRTIADTIEQLKEQWTLLKNSCDLYDKGFESEAKRIATTLRIFLHDTEVSKSLFNQLGIKETTKFLNTAHPFNPSNGVTSSCLTMCSYASDGKTSQAKIRPLLRQFFSIRPPTYENFSTWWEEMTIIHDKRVSFSRKRLILDVTNKDGGAHIDPHLPDDYHNLTRNNSMNFFFVVDGVEMPLTDFCLASIRQIGFEVDRILEGLNIHLWKC